MNSLVLVIAGLCLFALAYRYYGAFLAAKVAVLDANRLTPAHRLKDGRDYHPTNKYVLFGHHFAAISGAGPLVGPVLAAQFGYLPGAVWILVGAVLAGATHDFIILFASVRNDGLSISKIANNLIGKTASVATAIAVLFIIITALSGLAIVVVNALKESSWGVFSIGVTIPAAFLVGAWIYKIRPGKIAEASIIGVVIVIAGVIFGNNFAQSQFAKYLMFNEKQLTIILASYGFIASVLPVWLLLCPRDYLSSYMKIGTIALLVIGVFIVHPDITMPAFTPFIHGGGPIIPGKVWPFVCITIACGAISGFHALIGSGTTPKMISSEKDIRFIGYGAMLVEALVALMALVAATALLPGDYFAINTTVEKFNSIIKPLGFQITQLPQLEAMVKETLVNRPGGAVTLAVGMAKILTELPGMKQLMSYWYHFAIMFEALFILTTIDTGTRVARFIVQETLGTIYKPVRSANWLPGIILTSLIVCVCWGYMVYFGNISTIWPMFGVANQLLATIALAIGTTYILTYRNWKYALVTFIPMLYMATTTLTAGTMNIFNAYLPKHNYLNAGLSIIMIVLVVIILTTSVIRWVKIRTFS